ncbi:FAD-binding oxidoreductase [Microvirga aerilata]|uniref:FAD-binding oxidoreductase n=1 Tax=Microvirga aerilata TaxID=670292 RepID=A0A936Z7U0_9HYPH|nr:FAD-dependent oxidoreductase [Microvirga aerilata]MBL0405066.1 FAD-binding oxidoreductase [Microvirga aerilata]
MNEVGALIVGGGFYGCHIALALKELGFNRVRLIERENGLMRRASYVNQARVHNGYHYPRSLPTGMSSRRNFSRFVEEHSFAIVPNVQMVYGIARNSRVTGSQFARFCSEIGAPCREDKQAMVELFDPALIETCFSVNEIAFDSTALARDLAVRLNAAGIDCRLGVSGRISSWNASSVLVETSEGPVRAQYVFNCTYAYLDSLGIRTRNRIKKELAEIALVQPPRQMKGRAVTVMDGPFFSSMPFPALSCYSLTHVRYTPHMSWSKPGDDALRFEGSRSEAMMRDAMRYMPCMSDSTYLRSLYELKAILIRSEDSDSRPIVFEQSEDSERIYSVLGSKIDNIYDVHEYVKQKLWPLQ